MQLKTTILSQLKIYPSIKFKKLSVIFIFKSNQMQKMLVPQQFHSLTLLEVPEKIHQNYLYIYYQVNLGCNQLIVWFASAAHPNLEFKNPIFWGWKNGIVVALLDFCILYNICYHLRVAKTMTFLLHLASQIVPAHPSQLHHRQLLRILGKRN